SMVWPLLPGRTGNRPTLPPGACFAPDRLLAEGDLTHYLVSAKLGLMTTTGATATRLSKEERREAILDAAMEEFAKGGLDGTPVEAIAKRVGVSQPYLFQLFGTKKDLFIAAVRRGFERVLGTFRRAAATAGEDADYKEVLQAVGMSYGPLLE